MSNNKKYGGSGYYIALIACAAAIGITGYLYYRNAGEPEVSLQQDGDAIIAAVEDQQDVEAVATQGSAPAETTDPTKPTQKKTIKTGAPLAGETVSGYAMETLSYNQTTRDWRTHNGVDIAAEAGTEVVAAADGEVYTTYEDESLGYTVVIRHEGGYTTHYSSLGEDIRVQSGDRVQMGQVIGTVGSTALVETVLGPHVHFSVTHQDVPMDPADFFSLGN